MRTRKECRRRCQRSTEALRLYYAREIWQLVRRGATRSGLLQEIARVGDLMSPTRPFLFTIKSENIISYKSDTSHVQA